MALVTAASGFLGSQSDEIQLIVSLRERSVMDVITFVIKSPFHGLHVETNGLWFLLLLDCISVIFTKDCEPWDRESDLYLSCLKAIHHSDYHHISERFQDRFPGFYGKERHFVQNALLELPLK